MTAETFKKQILGVVEVWEDWIVFPPEFTTELRQRLEGAAIPLETKVEEKGEKAEEQRVSFASRFKQSSFKLATDAPSIEGEAMDVETDLDGKPVDDVNGEPVDDVDGEPVNDVDGEPVDDVDGEPVNDLDGEPSGDVDRGPVPNDLDGEPVDDIDGEPVGDIDGMPVDDCDGESVDDVDGVPIEDAM